MIPAVLLQRSRLEVVTLQKLSHVTVEGNSNISRVYHRTLCVVLNNNKSMIINKI